MENTDNTVPVTPCKCVPGYSFVTKTYPFYCACNIVAGGYLDGTCKNCSSLPETGPITSSGCLSCSYSQGFLLIPSNNTCVLCSSLSNTDGTATSQGCQCVTGYIWSAVSFACILNKCSGKYIMDPTTQACVCDWNNAILDGLNNCNLCTSYPYSVGLAANRNSCGCISNYFWTYDAANNKGSCTCTSNCIVCDLTKSVFVGVLCYDCSQDPLSTGPVIDTDKCACPSHLVWSWDIDTQKGKCIC